MQQRQSFGATQSQSSRPRQRLRRAGPTGVASLRYLPSGLFLQMEAPWNKPFQDEMKKSIPAKKRIWDANEKTWYILREQFDRLTHLLEKHYDETILLDFPPPEVARNTGAKLFLLDGAPIEVIRAAYKALAVKYHPDRGGDAEKMVELNTAYSELLGDLKDGQTN